MTGVQYQDRRAVAFGNLNEGLRRSGLLRKTVFRAMRWMAGALHDGGRPVIAIADARFPSAPALLSRLGFVRIGACRDGEVYLWRKPQSP